MNIKNLKEKWEFTGIDVDKMINDIVELLKYCKQPVTKYGAAMYLNKYIDAKKDVIELIMKSPFYNGNLQIVKKVEFEREIDDNAIYRLMSNFFDEVPARAHILCNKNKDGKTRNEILNEMIKEMPHTVTINDVANMTNVECDLSEFSSDGYTKESVSKLHNFANCVNEFAYYRVSTVSSTFLQTIKNYFPDIKGSEGMKTSKFFERVVTLVGVNTLKEYLAFRPKYGDSINSFKHMLNYVISVNPIDYLTMSFGNTWASCHTIDKTNVRGTRGDHYSGCYCGGTLSYACDHVSFVTYATKIQSEKPLELSDKIYRNMMHLSLENGYLVQGRVYPQTKDGKTDLYDLFRSLFQEELSSILKVQNLWVKKGDSYGRRYDGYFESEGAHYRDYEQCDDAYRGCNLTQLKYYDAPNKDKAMIIGAYGVNLYTGEERNVSDTVSYVKYISETERNEREFFAE